MGGGVVGSDGAEAAGGAEGLAVGAFLKGDCGASAPMFVSASRQFVALVGAASRADGVEGATSA